MRKRNFRVSDSAIHSDELFETCEEIFADFGYDRNDFWGVNSHDGSSYDGFMSFCEGWVEAVKELTYEDYLGGWFKDEKCQKIYENLCNREYDYKDYYEYEDGIKEKYPTYDDFLNAMSEDLELQENVDEYISTGHYETPAFLKVRLLFNDNTATLGVYLNDDLSYGRESVGSWAGKNCVGEYIGDHTNYEESIDFDNYEEVYAWLPQALKRAQETYGEEQF